MELRGTQSPRQNWSSPSTGVWEITGGWHFGYSECQKAKSPSPGWAFCFENHGAGKEARTLDLYLGKVSLYQLSYSRMVTICMVFKKFIVANFLNLVAWGGIEPPTQGFSILCSTD